MAYLAEISRLNPICFLFLVDQSGSMSQQWGGDCAKTKAQGVADAINALLQTMVIRCSKGEYVTDWCSIGVIGYGHDIMLGFPGELAGGVARPVSEIASNPLRIEDRVKELEDGAGGVVEQRTAFPVWFDPIAHGTTRMCQAFEVANQVLRAFIADHPRCRPPIVFNITDGVASDGDPRGPAVQLRSLASDDGNVLLFNIHISIYGGMPIVVPADDEHLNNEFARLLFDMSSPLPSAMLNLAATVGLSVEQGARGFAFNADLGLLITLLDFGTRVAEQFE